MNFTKIRSLMLLALGGVGLMTPTARAATAADGDLFLGVRANFGTGSDKCYVVRLGTALSFKNATAPISVDIGADLTATFGAGWKTATPLNSTTLQPKIAWGVAGATGSFNAIDTDPIKTLYASRAQLTPGTQSTPWLRKSDSAQGTTTSKFVSLLSAFNSAGTNGSTTNSVIQSTTDVNSWASYQRGGTVANSGPAPGISFDAWNPTIEGDFTNGTAGSILDLYRMQVNSTPNTNGDYLGRFVISDAGVVTYVPQALFNINTVQLSATTGSVVENAGPFTVTLTRTGDVSSTASVTLNTANGTAVAGTDYTAVTSQVVTFGINETSKTVDIAVADRTGYQGDRNLTVTISSPTNATLGANTTETVTINEFITTSTINLVDATLNITQDAGHTTATINLVRSGGSSPVTVDISAVSGDSATAADNAIAGTDFVAPSGAAATVTIPANTNTATATITLIPDVFATHNKSFKVSLTNAGANAAIGTTAPTTEVVTLLSTNLVSDINLVDSSFTVNQGTTSVTLHLARTGGTGPVSVDVVTHDGSATAGRDYTAPSPATVSFGTGVNSATMTITLTPDNTATNNRSFTITLGNASLNAAVGTTAPTTTSVTILADDAVAPVVTIATPTPGQAFDGKTAALVNVSGTVAEAVQLSSLEITANGTVLPPLTFGGAPSHSWSIDLTTSNGLKGGTNTVVVKATDTRGNVGTATRTFTYKRTKLLTLGTNPSNGSGGTAVATTPLTTEYEVGKIYTLTATPNTKAGYVFERWDIPGLAISNVGTENAKITFTYTDDILNSTNNPAIVARFIVNPFTASRIGDFWGLVSPHSIATPSNNSTNGQFKITISAAGALTGTLKIDGFTLSVIGSFNARGQDALDPNVTGTVREARFGANRSKTILVARGTTKSALEVSGVSWDTSTNKIKGMVKQYVRGTVVAQSDFELDRAGFSAASPIAPTSPYLENKGLYTVALKAKSLTSQPLQSVPLSESDYPQGDGVGSITIANTGIVTFVGTLADGASVTTSTAPLSSVNAGFKAPIFSELYTKRGSISLLVHPDNTAADTDLTATDCKWFCPWQSAAQYYPFGWEDGIVVDLIGSKYKTALPANVIPGLATAVVTSPNATVEFSYLADLDAPSTSLTTISNSVNITANVAKKTTLADALIGLTITAATGDVAGSFTHVDGTKPAFKGKVLQKGANAGVHGHFLTVKPKVIDGEGQSGKVSVRKLVAPAS